MVLAGKGVSVCIIPARGGSKRIPRKNFKNFCGKPVISYAIEAAMKSGCFDRVIVSTDCEEIAEVARSYGASTPFKRPVELSDDHTGTIPVVQHALNFISKKEGIEIKKVCCIYPVTPLLTAVHLTDSLEQYMASGSKFCMPVAAYQSPIQRAYSIKNDKLEMVNPDKFLVRTQDLDKCYYDAGQFYWGSFDDFMSFQGSFSGNAHPYIVKPYEFIDIDNIEDWEMAEFIFEKRNLAKC